MAIHLIIGFDTAGPTSPFRPIYAGRDADAARAAADDWSGETTLWLRNPDGVRKTNPRLSAARDAAARADDAARAVANAPAAEPCVERLAAQVERLQRENDRLKKQATTAAPAAPAPAPVLDLILESAPAIPASVPVADPPPSENDPGAPAEDPDTAERRKAALAAAEAAEQLEDAPPAQKKGRGK